MFDEDYDDDDDEDDNFDVGEDEDVHDDKMCCQWTLDGWMG